MHSYRRLLRLGLWEVMILFFLTHLSFPVFAHVTKQGGPDASTQPTPSLQRHTPTPSLTPVPTVGATQIIYIVQPGESIYSVAARYGIPIAELLRSNHLSTPSLLRPVQRLRIPVNSDEPSVVPAPAIQTTVPLSAPTPDPLRATAPIIHIVQPEETIAAIAQSYGVSINALAAYNGIRNPNLLRVGMPLRIPTDESAPKVMPGLTAPTPMPLPMPEYTAEARRE